ncbi:MAG: hypothetical protein KAS13_09120 [Candidatus Omnitrophica bacterium]|nr:hypothetical protein [Candidatus Omnitrophota bacterium]
MRESTQRRIILLLLVGAIISVLWAIGSNSRKKVELVKSESLESKLEKLIKANTAIVNDLKSSRNRLSAIQQSERLLKKRLAIETEKNEAMEKTIEKATSSALGTSTSIEELTKDAESLKNMNITLGEELLTLKSKDAALQAEIEKLRSLLAKPQEATTGKSRRKRNQRSKDSTEKETANRNFNLQ